MKQRLPEQRCLFCDEPANSREHIVGEWLGRALGIDKTVVTSHQSPTYQVKYSPIGGRPETHTTVKTRTGHVASRRERLVCGGCNNGWMSALEESVKPILGPMLDGAIPRVLSVEDQMLLATWAVKSAFVWEHAQNSRPVASRSRTLEFGRSRTPTQFTRAWLGRYEGDRRDPFIGDRQGLLVPAGLIVRLSNAETQANYRMSMMVNGSVLIIVTSASDDVGDRAPYRHVGESRFADRLTQIWPATAPLDWPGQRPSWSGADVRDVLSRPW